MKKMSLLVLVAAALSALGLTSCGSLPSSKTELTAKVLSSQTAMIDGNSGVYYRLDNEKYNVVFVTDVNRGVYPELDLKTGDVIKFYDPSARHSYSGRYKYYGPFSPADVVSFMQPQSFMITSVNGKPVSFTPW